MVRCWWWPCQLGPCATQQDKKHLFKGSCVHQIHEWCLVSQRTIVVCWSPINSTCRYNTNATIESYGPNFKSFLNSSNERFMSRQNDWLINHQTCDVGTHYWYNVQWKSLWFICNKKQRGNVVSTYTSQHYTNTNILISMDKNVAYVGYLNNRLEVWISIH